MAVCDIRDTSHLITCIVIIHPCPLTVGGKQFVSADIVDMLTSFIFFCDNLPVRIDKTYQLSVLFHLAAESFRVIVVFLDISGFGLHFCDAVQAVIQICIFSVAQCISLCIVAVCICFARRILCMFHCAGGQPSPVIMVAFPAVTGLHAGPVSGTVVGINMVVLLYQLSKYIIRIFCGPCKRCFLCPLSVFVVTVSIVCKDFFH